eukprot:CAMPEP_0117038546 /NCGR_PEP_ID=MMETSP0472-20121206/27113_1 /TAXON_ID=693140 ORGANISM="Tiarina fusus, Strain LIS" /NCGR_SAMPLE_ID=MMETSP0472 /ASSEMBLY_ACC=CAM_ASM_000603 /LENGTH=368 /DNA_ID=CAMNT_0004748797 /DNA_START=128 /DNA_END=1233 /DNA_ORIENTATION=+
MVFLILSFLVASSSIFQTHRRMIVAEQQEQHDNRSGFPSTGQGFHTLRAASSRRAKDSQKRAIFYNIYVPNGENRERAIEIVKEQLQMKKDVSTVLNDDSVPIHYTLIGDNDNNNSTTEEIQKVCGPNCHQLQYAKEGDEGLTLQSLFDYCTEHPDVQVTYLHNKGSFHPSERNENFREMLTKSVFSDECQIGMNELLVTQNDDDDDDDKENNNNTPFNICGARFASFPHFHMAGNMWTAQCSYIRTLIPPKDFVSKMDELIDHVLFSTDKTVPRPTFQQITGEFSVGRQRFAFEHWATSHPFVKPSDVYPGTIYARISGFAGSEVVALDTADRSGAEMEYEHVFENFADSGGMVLWASEIIRVLVSV